MQVPSVLFVKAEGDVLVGDVAEQRGAADPSRVVREFKRRIGDSVPLIIGGAPYSPQSMLARLLAWVVAIATQQQGAPPDHVCVTFPANWGPFKRDLLGQAIELAGLRDASTCTEPEAAAITYASRGRVADGARVAVYDLGGGTFDAAVLVREGEGFRLLGSPEGVEHLGGIDFDAAVFQHVLTSLGPGAENLDDTDQATMIGLARLRSDCVLAKEALSGDVDTVIPVTLPGITTSVRLTRDEFSDMLRPAIGETVSAMRRVLQSAGVEPSDLSAIIMVGGSSRIPLISQELSAAFGCPLAMDNQPKNDVALGAAIRGTPAAQPQAVRAGVPGGQQQVIEYRTGGAGSETAPEPWVDQPTGQMPPPQPAPMPYDQPPPEPAYAGPPPGWPPPGGMPPSPNGRPPEGQWAPNGAPWPPQGNTSGSGSGRTRWFILGGVALLVGLGAAAWLLFAGKETPPPVALPTTPVVAPTTTPPAPTTAPPVSLPASEQALADDVIVWPRQRGGNWDIAAITSAGAPVLELVASPQEDNFPVISPDRRTIIYLHRTSPTTQELRVVAADGAGDRALFASPPDGCSNMTRPAFGGPTPQLVLACVDATSKATTLMLVSTDGAVQRVIDRGWLGDPTMTPDGRYTVYWRNDANVDGGALYRAALDGSTPPAPITPGGELRDNDPAASPNGDMVALTRAGAGIWTVGLGPGNPLEQLTAKSGDKDPSWSPDGTQITFKRADQMWVMNADGSNDHRITKVGEIGTASAWSPR